MKIKQLIEILNKFDPETEVRFEEIIESPISSLGTGLMNRVEIILRKKGEEVYVEGEDEPIKLKEDVLIFKIVGEAILDDQKQ